MNGIQLKQMPRYKRADFEEEETSSASSFHSVVDPHPVTSSGFSQYHHLPPTGSSSNAGVPAAQQQLLDNSGSPTNLNSPTHVMVSQMRNTASVSFFGPSFGSSKMESSIVGRTRKRNFWDRASPLEKVLLITTSLLTGAICILIGILSMSTPTVVIQFPNSTESKEYCLTPACVTVASAIINAMDTNVDPCTDFYEYACGGWVKYNPLPDGKSIWGTFGKLWQENQLIMKNVLEQKKDPASLAERKAKIYYRSCLDKNETIEKLGSKPMADFLDKVGGWNISGSSFDVNRWNFEATLRVLHNKYDRGGFFSWAVGADEKNSTRNIIQLDQGGLGLPSRDYYLNKSSDDEVLNAYLTYMTKVGVLLGGEENSTRTQMKAVIDFETKLANITVPNDERRDDERTYNQMSLEKLQHLAPVINWVEYFGYAFRQINYNITKSDPIVIYSPDYLSQMSQLLQEYLSTNDGKIVVANYMGWSVVQSLTSALSKPFREASKILRKALIGSEGSESPWRYCVTDTNGVMGFALGAMFVESVFHGDSKPMAEAMISEIKEAFIQNLPNLKWMDPETRKLAKEKADSITDMIGFPDFILEPKKLDEKYDGLEFNENEYFENNIAFNEFSLKKNIKKIRKPANRKEWEMAPPTVNAYYTPTKNQIVFPAGILQTPFYDVNYPKSLNFGAMGVVMGHELTHAFDDQGREYDKHGNLHQWWQNKTIKNFEKRIQCFQDQYSSYEINGDHINGKQTVGENIADNGGLKAAFHAYEGWMKDHPAERPLPGVNLTERQLFFIGFAQVWCSVTTPEALKLQILNDPHSPAKFRVIGTLSNSDEFAKEFRCKAGSSMNPTNKCEAW